MKSFEKSSCRFVKEYANYKISIVKDLKRSFPDNKINDLTLERIETTLKTFSRHLISVDEAMREIANADSWAMMNILQERGCNND